jgi:S-adenosylmethionine synthetase
VAAKLAKRCEVQVSYAIGYPDPLNIWVNTEGTAAPGVTEDKLVALIRKHFDLTPKGIIEGLNLRRPIYRESARHGHFGRTNAEFTWEKAGQGGSPPPRRRCVIRLRVVGTLRVPSW